MTEIEYGVIGGSGLYELLEDVEEVAVSSPFGDPSDVVFVGEVAGRRVAFLPRHGRGHRVPPHRINYRANVWALRSLGVRQILAPSAVGGLSPDYGPGTLLIPDQFVDRTSGRVQTFYDGESLPDGSLAKVAHVSLADPYCPDGRATALAAASSHGWEPVDGGTLVVIEGPRFSTRAESRWFAANGWSVVGMTGHPEAVLARELALCYTPLCLVTDFDAGVEHGDGVTMADVFAAFSHNVDRLRSVLFTALENLPEKQDCVCSHALDGMG